MSLEHSIENVLVKEAMKIDDEQNEQNEQN